MADEEIKATKFSVEVAVDLEIDAVDIASKLSKDDLVRLIIELDDAMDDIDGTLELCAHFAKVQDVIQREGEA